MLPSKCTVCDITESRFTKKKKKQEGRGLLSILGLKTDLITIPILRLKV